MQGMPPSAMRVPLQTAHAVCSLPLASYCGAPPDPINGRMQFAVCPSLLEGIISIAVFQKRKANTYMLVECPALSAGRGALGLQCNMFSTIESPDELTYVYGSCRSSLPIVELLPIQSKPHTTATSCPRHLLLWSSSRSNRPAATSCPCHFLHRLLPDVVRPQLLEGDGPGAVDLIELSRALGGGRARGTEGGG